MSVAFVTHAELTPRLVDALYTEAMVLADEAHGYFDGPGRDDCEALTPIERVTFSCESLRVTTRLMHVIAWLLTQRAVSVGEISAVQGAAVERRLGDVAEGEPDALAQLPEAARAIAAAAIDIYARVRRLDRGDRLVASPVTSLIARLERAF